MPADPLDIVRSQLALHVAELRRRGPRLPARELSQRMEAIRLLAADHGMEALEGLARHSARRSLLPGRRAAMHSCLEHFDAAIDSVSAADRTTILAAIAVRLR